MNKDPENNFTGRIYASSTKDSKENGYDFAWAQFGPLPSAPDYSFLGDGKFNVARKIIAANPEFGCDAKESKMRVKGAVVAVMRGGGCVFGDKALVAMKLGAIGIIIVDNDNAGNTEDRPVTRIMAAEEQAEQITIPVVMVVHSFWKDLFGGKEAERISTAYAKVETTP